MSNNIQGFIKELAVTKYEAYLKKLFYLMKGREIRPHHEGESVTWKDVIYAVRPLWSLKYSEKSEYQTLYQYLLMVKEWRNKEAHISPTASEQEIDAAINIIITMYFFATGSCITELESNGHDVEEDFVAEPPHKRARRYVYKAELENERSMAAEGLGRNVEC